MKELIRPQTGELILDAGCSVGGASLWLAEHTDTRYIGITISDEQIRYAHRFLQQRDLAKRVLFLQRNYFDTGFDDKQFDKIFAIESFCYASPNPLPLYQEMYRILKPEGILVIQDGVYLRKPSTDRERVLDQNYCKGFALTAMCTPAEMKGALQKAGFKDIELRDTTRAIGPSMQDVDRRANLVRPLRFLLKRVGLVTRAEEDIFLAALHQKEMYDIGLFGHSAFKAKKPLQ